MQNQITNFYQKHDRKESMLLSMFYAYIVMLSVFSVISSWIEQYQDIFVNLVAIVLSIILLKKYIQNKNLRTTAILVLIVMEIHSGIMIASNHPNNFSVIFPCIYIATFFFFFTIKEALWATLLQFVYFGTIATIVLNLNSEPHVVVTPVTAINNMTNTFVIMAIGIFYQFTTEISYQKLQKADKEKKQLLDSIHYKIRNNLNFVSSLLGLQIRHIKKNLKQDNIDVLKNTRGRVQSIALSHRALYSEGNIIHIEVKEYIQNLINLVNEIYKTDIKLRCETNKIFFLEETTHRVGLILNELFSMSLKNSTKKREIVVKISQKDDKYLFFYHDIESDIQLQKHLFSQKLINLIVEQMDAKIEFSNSKGMMCKVWFSV